ncbi:MAG: hypothetical protein J6K12_00880, partial [Clostridia bacterium]|nr:hypothetical protein [Clostridia bacterium]
MGIFSKFFKGKKIIEATVEKALEENETKNLPEMQDKALADEIDRAEQKAAESIRVIAKQYLPADVSSDYCQLEMVKTLINNIRVPESLYSETEKLLQKVKTGEITFIQCSGAVANRINNWMNDENCANLSQSLQDNNNDALLKTWVSIDYYISTLKRDFSKNLRKIRNELTEKIVLLGLDKADNQELSDIITLEKELNETAKDKEKVKTAEFAAKRK